MDPLTTIYSCCVLRIDNPHDDIITRQYSMKPLGVLYKVADTARYRSLHNWQLLETKNRFQGKLAF